MINREQIIADIIEDALSGQYGRDIAEKLADEIVRVLDMKAPIKFQIGINLSDGQTNWNWGDFVYAESQSDALTLASEKIFPQFRYSIRVRPYAEGVERALCFSLPKITLDKQPKT